MVSLFPAPSPCLPDFCSLIVSGSYHASAPIHLALSTRSELGPATRILLLTPAQATFKEAMAQFNDYWLYRYSGIGKTCELLENVTIFYPPTPVHLSLLLSMMHVPSEDTPHEYLNPKTTQIVAPSLLILLEPSHYFLSSSNPDMTATPVPLTSYLNLITRIFSCITNLTSDPIQPKFALFDSQLVFMSLPFVYEPALPTDETSSAEAPSTRPALPVVERLFEWIGIFEEDYDFYVPSSQGEEACPEEGTRKQLRLYQDSDGDAEVVKWTEVRRSGENGEADATDFVW